ncbi:hypothetical protein ANCDUO_11358 [Ancylostoma duodenale]|uniref:Uncharacterized protein n=1 Tax=Ancylostoma duodenale TaxID=51022 RepID=A0A0C2GBQ0_9BILA|nr:hypothetical protein ANCDUO_11358 [Ancylostoma duodenale]
MLRWMAGITRADSIRSERIQEWFCIARIVDKIRESRLDGVTTFVAPTKSTLARIEIPIKCELPIVRTPQLMQLQ